MSNQQRVSANMPPTKQRSERLPDAQPDYTTVVRTPSRSHSLLQLQKKYGNYYVQRMVELYRRSDNIANVALDTKRSIQRSYNDKLLDDGMNVHVNSQRDTSIQRREKRKSEVENLTVKLERRGISVLIVFSREISYEKAWEYLFGSVNWDDKEIQEIHTAFQRDPSEKADKSGRQKNYFFGGNYYSSAYLRMRENVKLLLPPEQPGHTPLQLDQLTEIVAFAKSVLPKETYEDKRLRCVLDKILEPGINDKYLSVYVLHRKSDELAHREKKEFTDADWEELLDGSVKQRLINIKVPKQDLPKEELASKTKEFIKELQAIYQAIWLGIREMQMTAESVKHDFVSEEALSRIAKLQSDKTSIYSCWAERME